MYILMYFSELLPELHNEVDYVLSEIERRAKAHNPDVNVNGVLFFDRGRFVQLLEGTEEDVWGLYQEIALDRRHDNLQLIFFEPVRQQEFQQWNMDVFNLEAMELEAKDGETTDLDPISAEDLQKFRRVYLHNEQPSSDEVARWVKRLITQPAARF